MMKKNIIRNALPIAIISFIIISLFCKVNAVANTDIKIEKEIKIAANETNTTEDLEAYNSYLKSLKIEGYEFFPEFNKNTTTYYVSIPLDVDDLNVSAEAESEDASVKITGTSDLSRYEENTIRIYVSPEKGDRRTYKIIATKQEDNGLKLTNLEVEGATLNPEFQSNKYYYTVDITQNNELKPLNIKTTANSETAKVEILGNDSSLAESESIISIILTEGKKTTIYQLKANIQIEKGVFQSTEDNNKKGINFGEIFDNIKNFFADETRLVAFLVAVAVVLTLCIIIVVIRMVKRNKIEKNKQKIKKRAK